MRSLLRSPDGRATADVAALRRRLAELADIDDAAELLAWDEHTAPSGSSGARGEQLATLAAVRHERAAAPDLLAALRAAAAAPLDPGSWDARLVRVALRDAERTARVPAALLSEIAEAGSAGMAAWARARATSDFAVLAPHLERQLELKRRYAAVVAPGADPYDALLDEHEPGLMRAELAPLFGELRERLLPVAAELRRREPSPARGAVRLPRAAQERLVLELLDALGLGGGAVRLASAPHPFSARLGPRLAGIAIRYDEDDVATALAATLHEAGHALYELGSAPELARTTADHGASAALHEAVARLFERRVGRSPAFCAWLLPRLRAAGAGGLGRTPEELRAALDAGCTPLVRVDADDVAYALHVIARFELEVDLVEGRADVAGLPAAFDAKLEDYLGVSPPEPGVNVLQDPHWAYGAFGHFPTYLLGDLVADGLWRELHRDVPSVEPRIARGDFAHVAEWLRSRLFEGGRTVDAADTVRALRSEPAAYAASVRRTAAPL